MLLLDRVGRKITLVSSLIGSAVCAVGFAYAKTEATVLLASCLLSAVSVGSWNALDAMSVEYFPSAVRSSAMGSE
jgi:MFS family permease